MYRMTPIGATAAARNSMLGFDVAQGKYGSPGQRDSSIACGDYSHLFGSPSAEAQRRSRTAREDVRLEQMCVISALPALSAEGDSTILAEGYIETQR
jgi:hypothetical protein